MIVGSERTMFYTMEARITQKFTVNAWLLVLEIVEKRKASHMYEVVVRNKRAKNTHHGVLTKTSKSFHFPMATISKLMKMFIKVPVKTHEAQYALS